MRLRVFPIETDRFVMVCLLDGRQVRGYCTAGFLQLPMVLHLLVKIVGPRRWLTPVVNDEPMLHEGAFADGRLSIQHGSILLMAVFRRGGLILPYDNFTLVLLQNHLDYLYLAAFLPREKLRKLAKLVEMLILLSPMQPTFSFFLQLLICLIHFGCVLCECLVQGMFPFSVFHIN